MNLCSLALIIERYLAKLSPSASVTFLIQYNTNWAIPNSRQCEHSAKVALVAHPFRKPAASWPWPFDGYRSRTWHLRSQASCHLRCPINWRSRVCNGMVARAHVFADTALSPPFHPAYMCSLCVWIKLSICLFACLGAQDLHFTNGI